MTSAGRVLTPEAAPEVIMDARGNYWRRYPEHLSMCPVSDDNLPLAEPLVVYRPAPVAPVRVFAEIAKHLPPEMVKAFWDAAAEAHLVALEQWAGIEPPAKDDQ